jgi:alkanesulfonate monooxygenase SsuD/methylene tetrahydromethanopterin reductase-like flavin-dependent oxidoreductase (luciferase family)
MKISTFLSYSGGFRQAAAEVVEFEKAGLDLVWVAEAYGLDGPSLMGYLAALTERVEIGSAILPIYTRTPTLIAMTAAGVDTLSDGRFHLGLGSSGPQVIEGWHGVPSTPPSAGPARSSTSAGRSGPGRRPWSTRGPTTPCRSRPRRGPGWARRSRSSPIRCGRPSRSGWRHSARRTWP